MKSLAGLKDINTIASLMATLYSIILGLSQRLKKITSLPVQMGCLILEGFQKLYVAL